MTNFENLQLENLLVTGLNGIGFPIGDRVYFQDYVSIAKEDDEVNRMMGLPTAEDFEDKGSTKEERLVNAIHEFRVLSEAQRDTSNEFEFLFRRIGNRKPWRVEYEVAHEGSEYGEIVDLDYNDITLLTIGNGLKNGKMSVDLGVRKEHLLDYSSFVIYEKLKNIEIFGGNEFDPKFIVDTVVGLIDE